MLEKENQRKRDFLVKSSNILLTIRNVLHYLILFLPIKIYAAREPFGDIGRIGMYILLFIIFIII